MGSRFFGPSIDLDASESAIEQELLTGGTVSNLRVFLTAAPSSGDTYTFTARRDPASGSASNTSITCSISGSSSASCEDSSHSQKFEAGDAVSIVATESNSPGPADMFFRLEFQP
jgi:hypothetical protein